MIIIRDGKKIELTPEEVMQAHDEYERRCLILDIESVLDDEVDKDYADIVVEAVADVAETYLRKSDAYGDAYFECIYAALRDVAGN